MSFTNQKLIPSGTYMIINVKHGCSVTCRKDQVLQSSSNGYNVGIYHFSYESISILHKLVDHYSTSQQEMDHPESLRWAFCSPRSRSGGRRQNKCTGKSRRTSSMGYQAMYRVSGLSHVCSQLCVLILWTSIHFEQNLLPQTDRTLLESSEC
jgi:hypothetical protein